MSKIFSIWRFVVSVGFARSGTWSNTTEVEQRTYIVSLHLLRREDKTAINLVIGPLSLIVGFVM